MRLFVPFLLALLAIAIVLRVDLFFTVVYFLVAVYVGSRVWVSQAVKNTRLVRVFPDRAFVGEGIEVRVRVCNLGWLPIPWLQITESTPIELRTVQTPAQVVGLGPRAETSFTYALQCRRRGYYRLGPFSVAAGDVLGLEQETLGEGATDFLLVYPRLVTIDRLGLQSLAAQAAIRAQSPLIEDPARVTGVRDYQRGDSPRRIHWTATARSSRLLVKQYDPSIARDTMIFLDLNQTAYPSTPWEDPIELAIVTAASIANHIIAREGLAAGLAMMGRDPVVGPEVHVLVRPPRRENAALVSVLEVLARVQSQADENLIELIRRESVRLPWGSTLVVITGFGGDDLVSLLAYLRRSGFAVTLILVQPGSVTSMEMPALAGISTHVVGSDRDLAGIH